MCYHGPRAVSENASFIGLRFYWLRPIIARFTTNEQITWPTVTTAVFYCQKNIFDSGVLSPATVTTAVSYCQKNIFYFKGSKKFSL